MYGLHRELQHETGDMVEVYLDHPANVQLLDGENYRLYAEDRPYRYAGGGYRTESPGRIETPAAGQWHLTLDLGGG